jgi:triosephosphate isomerase
MNRKKIVAGNWKMNMDPTGTAELLTAIVGMPWVPTGEADVCVCPPFPSLLRAKHIVEGNRIMLGAQDMSEHDGGAFTGEVSAKMLVSAGCSHVILGHSERRQYHHETDGLINRKVVRALSAGLVPIVCVGESLSEREKGETAGRITSQVGGVLANLTGGQVAGLIIAYEPVWAIGTGKTASPEQANEIHSLIRGLLKTKFDEKTSISARIIYGGSVNEKNAAELFSMPDIDGGLIGGASLKADSFSAICIAAG